MSECIGRGCTSPGCSGNNASTVNSFADQQHLHVHVPHEGVKVPRHTFAVPGRKERRAEERAAKREATRRTGKGSRKL